MGGAPDGLWLMEENKQRQKRNTGVLPLRQAQGQKDNQKRATARAGWGSLYIPTHRKNAMGGAPDGLWLMEENKQRHQQRQFGG
jgi:hypothetical protein